MKYLLSIGLALGLAGPVMAQSISPDQAIRSVRVAKTSGRAIGLMICYSMLDNRVSDTRATLIREAMMRYEREGPMPGLIEAYSRLENTHPSKDAHTQGLWDAIQENCPGFLDLP